MTQNGQLPKESMIQTMDLTQQKQATPWIWVRLKVRSCWCVLTYIYTSETKLSCNGKYEQKIFLILKFLCMNIEIWATRQKVNVDKLVIFWFCTQNRPKITKVCIFGRKTVIFVPSNHPDPPKHTFSTLPLWALQPRKNDLQTFLKNLVLGVLPFLN